jgi:hypothetical protein
VIPFSTNSTSTLTLTYSVIHTGCSTMKVLFFGAQIRLYP